MEAPKSNDSVKDEQALYTPKSGNPTSLAVKLAVIFWFSKSPKINASTVLFSILSIRLFTAVYMIFLSAFL